MSDYMQVIRDALEMCKACGECRKCPLFIIVGMDFCPFDSLFMDEWEEIAMRIHKWKQNKGG